MNTHNSATPSLVCMVIGGIFFAFAAFSWFGGPPFEPHRVRLIAAGAFFCVLSTFV